MTLCCACLEIGQRDCNCIFAERHSAKVEFPVPVGFLVLYPIGSLRLQIDRRVLNGTVLGIMNDAMHGPEYLPSAGAEPIVSAHTTRTKTNAVTPKRILRLICSLAFG